MTAYLNLIIAIVVINPCTKFRCEVDYHLYMIDNDFEALQGEYLMLSKELFRNLKEKDETHEIVHLPVNILGKISYSLYI
jgi:hypothetical protein